MLGGTQAIPAFDVMYFTSEDSDSCVCDLVKLYGGDVDRLHMYDIAKQEDPIDFLEHLKEIEAEINSLGVRLLILDALNSFVGGDISTDSKARRTLSGKLQALARRTGTCVLGIRNWGRNDAGTPSQKSLGATSLSDVARCVMNTQEVLVKEGEPPQFLLEWEKVSDAPKPLPIPYWVQNLSTGAGNSHLRRLLWGKPTATKARCNSLHLQPQSGAKGAAKKGGAKR